MRRYWLPQEALGETMVNIADEYHKHICQVCRRQVGDKFEVLNGGKAWLVELIEVGKKTATAKIIDLRAIPPLAKPHIHLALSLPKLSTLEKVLEKSVELGVQHLHVFVSDYSFMRAGAKELKEKQKRWQKIILGATQQTGRGDLMGLTFGQDLSVLLATFAARPGAHGLFAFEGEGQQSLAQSLRQWSSASEEVWIFVGSEGGFSSADIDLFSNYKMIPTSLGPQVLRVETACVALISVIKYGLGQFA